MYGRLFLSRCVKVSLEVPMALFKPLKLSFQFLYLSLASAILRLFDLSVSAFVSTPNPGASNPGTLVQWTSWAWTVTFWVVIVGAVLERSMKPESRWVSFGLIGDEGKSLVGDRGRDCEDDPGDVFSATRSVSYSFNHNQQHCLLTKFYQEHFWRCHYPFFWFSCDIGGPTMISFWSVSIAHKPYFSLILISTTSGNAEALESVLWDSSTDRLQISYLF